MVRECTEDVDIIHNRLPHRCLCRIIHRRLPHGCLRPAMSRHAVTYVGITVTVGADIKDLGGHVLSGVVFVVWLAVLLWRHLLAVLLWRHLLAVLLWLHLLAVLLWRHLLTGFMTFGCLHLHWKHTDQFLTMTVSIRKAIPMLRIMWLLPGRLSKDYVIYYYYIIIIIQSLP